MTFRKSLFPFWGCLGVISSPTFDFSENTTHRHITYGWGRLRICVGFNEVTSLTVLLPPVEPGRPVEAWQVSPRLHFQKHSRGAEVPCRDKNEPAVQRAVRGVGPGASGFFYEQGEWEGGKNRDGNKAGGSQCGTFFSFKTIFSSHGGRRGVDFHAWPFHSMLNGQLNDFTQTWTTSVYVFYALRTKWKSVLPL